MMLNDDDRTKVKSRQDGEIAPQVFGGGPSDRIDVMENGEPRHTGDLRHVGGDPGVVHARIRDSRRGEHARK